MARRVLILFAVMGVLLIIGASLSFLFPPVKLVSPVQINEGRMVAAISPAVTWHKIDATPWAARDSHTSYLFQGKLWVLGGLSVFPGGRSVSMSQYAEAAYYNDIWSSSDGKNWQEMTREAAFPPIRSASVIERAGTLYLLGGWSPVVNYQIGIWQSTDGFTWQQVATTAPFGEREGQRVVEWNNRFYLLGGVNYDEARLFNDVWVSDDGLNWEKLASSNPLRPENPWKPRWDHDVVVFQDKLWLAGGMGFSGNGYGDVWSSVDGRNWKLEADITPWGRRQGHILDVFRDRLWLIGGLGIETNAVNGNTWITADGKTWQPLPAGELDGVWSAREDHSAVVFQDKLWLLGGMDENWNWTNDVWYLN